MNKSLNYAPKTTDHCLQDAKVSQAQAVSCADYQDLSIIYY